MSPTLSRTHPKYSIGSKVAIRYQHQYCQEHNISIATNLDFFQVAKVVLQNQDWQYQLLYGRGTEETFWMSEGELVGWRSVGERSTTR